MFGVTDVISIIIIALCMLTPFGLLLEPKYAGWSLLENTALIKMSFELIITFLHGVGFYLLLKRKIIGFLFIIITSIIFIFIRNNIIYIYYLATILIFYAFPWATTYIELKNAKET